MNDLRPCFIVLEGIDGVGKTTQLSRLAEILKQTGKEIIKTREPGGSLGAEKIRQLLLKGESDRWSPYTELLLFNAARRDHYERTIQPALARGAFVLCDRFIDSTRVYQSIGKGVPCELIDRLHEMFIQREADLVFILDAPLEDLSLRSLTHKNYKKDRFERMGALFYEQLRQAFIDLARKTPERRYLIDATMPPEEITTEMIHILRKSQ